MDRNRNASFKRRSNSQFKKKGFKKNRRHNIGHEQISGNPHAADIVYRILCPTSKIGGVIGKGGSIVKALRDETGAKITVAESVPGADERVIIVFSSSSGESRRFGTNEDSEVDTETDKEHEFMQPLCPAQDALLKVYDRIAEEEDIYGGMGKEDNNEETVVTARLLVPNNQVGCLLGKGGNVIQKLRNEISANIRILSAKHLPACAMSTDELVQITGLSSVVKRALYEVSSLLYRNPRKDNPPPNYPVPAGGQGFYPPGPPMANMPPPGNPMWSHRNSGAHGAPPMPWNGGYGNQSSGFGPGGGGDVSGEFYMKILCSAEKIGVVIGKGGCNVKQLEQETGAKIHVEDPTLLSDERVILVTSFEAMWNPRSQTIEAVLQLQSKTSEISEKGIITTRLLVPSNKVGCLLGQGGHVITEMRRRTQADIRVYSKDGKPECASPDEELVQISGNFNVAKDALGEVASRLRTRFLRDANSSIEPPPAGPFQGFGPSGSFTGRGPPLPNMGGASSSIGYEPVKGVRPEYETQNYPVQPAVSGYQNINSSMEVKIPNNSVGSLVGTAGSSISHIGEISGARVKLQDPQAGGSECVVEIHGSSEQMNAAQNLLQSFMANAVQNFNGQQGSYQY